MQITDKGVCEERKEDDNSQLVDNQSLDEIGNLSEKMIVAEEADQASCLAEQLWLPFRILVMNPGISAFVFVVIDSIFICTWVTLAWIADRITRPGLFMLILGFIVLFARFITLVMTYPGHLRVVMRDTEKNFGKIMKRRISYAMEVSNSFINILQEPHPSMNRKFEFMQNYDQLTHIIEELISPFYMSLGKLLDENLLSQDGIAFMEEVGKYLDQIRQIEPLCRQIFNADMKDFEKVRLELFYVRGEHPQVSSSKKSLDSLNESIESVKDMIPCLVEETEKKSMGGIFWFFQTFWNAHKPLNALASLDLMRAHLAAKHNGEQVWIKGDDSSTDGMFIPAQGLDCSESNVEKTVILCNPNAGLYEFHHFQSDWIQFYTQRGCNVFVFNYRGYGRNKGYPSPHANNIDGEFVVKYLLETRKIVRLAVHGESIGGLVATHIAQKFKNIEVLIADRTFSNLPAVAQRLVAAWAGSTVSFVTRWKTDNVENYIRANCSKITCNDPNDEIIADPSSLRVGIALRLEMDDMSIKIPNKDAYMQQLHEMEASGAVDYPVVGKKLSELHIYQFYVAIRGITTLLADEFEMCVEQHIVELPELSMSISHGVLEKIWSAICGIDGCCGQLLVSALENEYEGVRAWIASLLVWGPSMSDKENCIIAEDVSAENIKRVALNRGYSNLIKVVTENPTTKNDTRCNYAIRMIEYLHQTLNNRSAQLKSMEQEGNADAELSSCYSDIYFHPSKIGFLIPLSCGHNANLSDFEKGILAHHLKKFGWLE